MFYQWYCIFWKLSYKNTEKHTKQTIYYTWAVKQIETINLHIQSVIKYHTTSLNTVSLFHFFNELSFSTRMLILKCIFETKQQIKHLKFLLAIEYIWFSVVKYGAIRNAEWVSSTVRKLKLSRWIYDSNYGNESVDLENNIMILAGIARQHEYKQFFHVP